MQLSKLHRSKRLAFSVKDFAQVSDSASLPTFIASTSTAVGEDIGGYLERSREPAVEPAHLAAI